MNTVSFDEPTAGDIVWCYFPDGYPVPKPRPGLVLAVYEGEDSEFVVNIIYGTGVQTEELQPGEFLISGSANPAAFELAGLSYDTQFNVKAQAKLPYTSEYFIVPPHAPHGQNPRLGTLHASLVFSLRSAYYA